MSLMTLLQVEQFAEPHMPTRALADAQAAVPEHSGFEGDDQRHEAN
jgi:hypothetical protein